MSMRLWKLLLLTFSILSCTILMIWTLAYFGIEMSLISLISLLFTETTLIFFFTVVVVWRVHSRSV